MTSLYVYSFALILLISPLNTQQCDQNQVQCPNNGACVSDYSECPVSMICPDGFFNCNEYQCTNNISKCPTVKCPKITCWDNSCADDYSKCPSFMWCPSTVETRFKCHDNTCTGSKDFCAPYNTCPDIFPIRCPNGDCRRNLNDCPSLIKCPSAFSILCNDNSCRLSEYDCLFPAINTQCIDSTMVRCSDGSCSKSKFLCPTLKTCPVGWVECWNGLCVESYDKCDAAPQGRTSTCSQNTVRCSDGSCVDSIENCPSVRICPINKPVRCWDYSCRESIDKCPVFQKCPAGTIECADGSCTSVDSESCGTHITCSEDAPYICFDNTCRRNPNDCPVPNECPVTSPIRCWDGKCVSNRGDCIAPDDCKGIAKVRCPDNLCKKTIDDCREITECPFGFTRCADGTCRRDELDCEDFKCPIEKYQCKDGQCVDDKDHCVVNETGCPFYAPIKCEDGSCLNDASKCPKGTICKDLYKRLCPNGSCIASNLPCPLKNGCTNDFPFRCSDGTCINDKKEKCAIPICPPASPIRCASGLCVTTISSCPIDNTGISSKNCPEGLNECVDGTCAASLDECKPVSKCSNGYERCPDGSCASSVDFCPLANTCPKDKPYRCDNGACATNDFMCLNISGCPEKYPMKCSTNGACVEDINDCSSVDQNLGLNNGCSADTPVKCSNGKCVNNLNDCSPKLCEEPLIYCPPAKTCVKSKRQCSSMGIKECESNLIKCPDDTCKTKLEECLNVNQCPYDSPFRCLDGSCKRYPFKQSSNDSNSCDVNLSCPDYSPILCLNGSCEQKAMFCPSVQICPESNPIMCFDRTCAKSKDECNKKLRVCPSGSPILCMSNSNCVSDIIKCFNNDCPNDHPFKCINGNCVDNPSMCINNAYQSKSLCTKENEVTCTDGSCRLHKDYCPIYQGCLSLSKPKKCPDGSCVSLNGECPSSLENLQKTCAKDESLCSDGICRKECILANGCSNDKPILCPIGICASKISECAGISYCPLESPFQCFNGDCVSSFEQCSFLKRLFTSTDIAIYAYNNNSIESNILYGNNGDILGIINIPSNSFKNRNANEPVQIQIKSVPVNSLSNTVSSYEYTRQSDIQVIFPYADEKNNYRLEAQYLILSPVINIKIQEDVKLANNIYIMLAFDFPNRHNYQDKIIFNVLKDVCLANLNQNNEWKCIGNQYYIEQKTNYNFYTSINGSGTYSVIFNPLKIEQNPQFVSNFFLDYIGYILLAIAVVAIVILVGLFVFWRIYRYRGKYKDQINQAKEIEAKMQELQSFGNNVGQTINDNLENIVYSTNPCFKMAENTVKNSRKVELELLQEQLFKKYKMLETNQGQLKKNADYLANEINRIRETLIEKETKNAAPLTTSRNLMDDSKEY